MPSYHQQKAGIPFLGHATQWRSYNPKGHLGVMTFDTQEACFAYCAKTGDVPVAPVKREEKTWQQN